MKSSYALASALTAAVASAGLGAPAVAQSKLHAEYTAYLGAVPVGHGGWVVEIAGDRYSAALRGGTSGLARLFASGSGTGSVTGAINNGVFVPTYYESTIKTDRWVNDVRVSFAGGNVKDVGIDPVPPPNPDRVPITEAQLRAAADPLSASLVRVPSGDMIGEQACTRGASVFTGRLRFDVLTRFKRIEPVKAKGYQGPAVVCAAYFKPIAGHVPDRGVIKHLQEQRDMEVFLVPVGGTRVMAPYRVTVPTSVGLGALTATQFVVEPLPAVTPTSARTE